MIIFKITAVLSFCLSPLPSRRWLDVLEMETRPTLSGFPKSCWTVPQMRAVTILSSTGAPSPPEELEVLAGLGVFYVYFVFLFRLISFSLRPTLSFKAERGEVD